MRGASDVGGRGGGARGVGTVVRISIKFRDESIWHGAWPASFLSVDGWYRGPDEQSEAVCLLCGQSGQRLCLLIPPHPPTFFFF